jgi:DNA-binding NarL/FixJ family response regulator
MARAERKIRVLICNQYTLFREGIKALLVEKGTAIEIVGEADTAAEVIEQLERLKPDVVLMDVGTPDATGFEATQNIKAIDPQVKVLILSVHDDDALIARCLEAGASGYIRTGDHVAQLRNAIDAACLDKRAIGSETAEIGVRSA